LEVALGSVYPIGFARKKISLFSMLGGMSLTTCRSWLRINSISCASIVIRSIVGADPATGLPTPARLQLVPSAGSPAGNAWQAPLVVKGQPQGNNMWWQGWYSQTYDGHWPAPTLVYNSAIAAADTATFAWLIVPYATQAAALPASLTVESADDTAVAVKVVIGGVTTEVNVAVESQWAE